MIQHLEQIAAASFTAGAGIVAGTILAVGVPEATVSTWVGGLVGGAIALGAAAAGKNWVEAQVSKFIEMPTKKELFDKIDDVAKKVENLHAFYQSEFIPLRERVIRIEERHALIDRTEED